MKNAVFFITAVLGMVIVGCSRGAGPQETDGSGPLAIEWVVYNQNGFLPNPDSEVKKLIEEKFNVQITIPALDVHNLEQWNLFWASGNMPMVVNCNKGQGTLRTFFDQGIVREIPDGWLDQYMPDYMDITYATVSKEDVYAQISYNGKVLQLPRSGGSSPLSMAVRQDWLDNLNITAYPETVDEFYELLRRFTFDDPDGNGRNDTYGVHAGMKDWWGGLRYVDIALDVHRKAFLESGGKVTLTDVTDAYKDYLKRINSWYKAGVIEPESFIDDGTRLKQKWANGMFGVISVNAWWLWPSVPNNFQSVVTTVNPRAKSVQLPPLKTAQGKKLRPEPLISVWNGPRFFTTKASDAVVQKILEINNEMVKDPSFFIRVAYGVEGRDYDMVDGLLTQRPEAVNIEYITEKGISSTFGGISSTWESTKSMGLVGKEEAALYDFVYQFEPTPVIIPAAGGPLFVFTKTNEAMNLYWTDIATLCDEYYANAITGMVNIDATFENFKNSLYDAGLQKVIDEYEAGL
jgi:putative aldouronate transport system substrate-binding protein